MAPARLVSVPRPIALRYLTKDDKGLAHICERSAPTPVQSDKTAESAQATVPLRS
jgi:hypothetical protein